jgi:hypothetical protein
VAEGVIAGNSVAALPAPMRRLASAFKFGMGPSGSAGRGAEFEALADEWVAEAEVTDVIPAAAGGVHLAVVAMLAVAVSLTEVTEVAFEGTAICA